MVLPWVPVRVFAIACDPHKRFDKVAHFSLKKGHGKHDDECGVAGLNILIKKARRKPIEVNDILLGYLPHSVVFRDRVETISEPPVRTGGAGPGTCVPPPGPHSLRNTMFHRASRTSINPVCRAHAAFKNAEFRESQSLEIEGCLGSNYRDTFYQLQKFQPNANLPELYGCIFYGELRFRSKPNYDDPERLILTLNCGSRAPGRFYRLAVRWDGWSEQLRALFVKEVEANRLATNKRYDSRDNSKTFKPDIIVYFLDQQLNGSPLDFEVSDYRKVAIVVEPNGLYKDYPNHSFLRKYQPVAETPQPPRNEASPNVETIYTPHPQPPPTQPDAWAATRPQSAPEQQIARAAAAARGTMPVVTDHYRRVGGPSPPTFMPEPKPRTGFLKWLKTLFE